MKVRARTVCHTCRARKLGCDGKVPSCSQCLLRGYECAGYRHDLIFRPTEVASTYKPKSRGRVGKPNRAPALSFNLTERKDVSKRGLGVPEPATDQAAITRSLSWPLQDMISLLVQNFSPVGYSDTSPLSETSPPRICGAWIEALPELAAKREHEPMLFSAVKAFATAILAQGCRGWAPVCDAIRAYGLAVNSLRKGLQNQPACSNVFIATIMCLFLSEAILPTNGTTLSIHAQGIEDLMELSTPASYATGDSHKLFAGFRPVLILQALSKRQPNFVAKAQWNIAPFSQIPMNPLQTMMTNATQLAAILGQVDEAKNLPRPRSVQVAQQALRKLIQMLTTLSEWAQSSDIITAVNRLELSCSREGSPGLWFPSITAANCFTHFWAFWVICVENIRHLLVDFPDLASAQICISGQRLEEMLDPDKIVQICGWLLEGVGFLLQDEYKLFGAASAVLPARTAHETLTGHGQSGRRMLERHQGLLDMIVRKGYHFLKL